MTTVADGFASLDSLDREDGGEQRAYVAESGAIERYAVETDAQAAHIKLIRREALYTGRVADVADNRPFATLTQRQKTAIAQRQKTLFEGVSTLLEVVNLLHRERIKLLLVAACQV